MRRSARFSIFRRRAVAALCPLLAGLVLLGCDQRPEPPSVSPPAPPGNSRDGFSERLGTDGAAQSERASHPSADDRPRIVAFGDSLTAGLGVAPEDSYPAHLQRRLDTAGYRYRVINAGISGETTAGGLRRVPWILQSRPSLVILELGGNDGLRGLNVEETRSNLEQIIERLLAEKVPVVLAGMKLPPNYGADYTSRFEAIYPELAKTYGLTLIPFFLEGVAAKATLNQADGIHPTGEGYRLIAENIFRTIAPLLAEPP
ncbi:MAG: arylesterase [Nitrospirota bacterium]